MKILHILDHSIPLYSGYTFRTRAILEQQRALGWETIHVTSCKHKGAEYGHEEVNGFRFYRSKTPNQWISKFPIIDQIAVVYSLEKRLHEVIDQEKPNILHAHSPALNGLAALRAARKHSLPLVYECRAFWEDAAVDHGTSLEGGVRYRMTRALESYVFKKADAITTICEGLQRDIVRRGIVSNKITVIPNAVDTARFEFNNTPNQKLRKELGLSGKVVLGYIGSFYAYEGISVLLDAIPAIVQSRPEICLMLIGGGPQEAEIKAKVEQLGISDQVVLVGRVPHDEVNKYYDQVDILIYPRLSMRLTELVTPLKPLEAMAQGKLIIASDVGGHKELIRDGQTGILFKAGDVSRLVHFVFELLENKGHWADMKKSGRQYVENERNWGKSVGRYKEIYESLIDA